MRVLVTKQGKMVSRAEKFRPALTSKEAHVTPPPSLEVTDAQIAILAKKIAEAIGTRTPLNGPTMPQDRTVRTPPRVYIPPTQPSLIRETGMETHLAPETVTKAVDLDSTAQELAKVLGNQ